MFNDELCSVIKCNHYFVLKFWITECFYFLLTAHGFEKCLFRNFTTVKISSLIKQDVDYLTTIFIATNFLWYFIIFIDVISA